MSILVRIVGGIVGRGAKTVAPINRNMSTGSVKVIPQSSISKVRAKSVNEYNTNKTNYTKSGANAKSAAKNIEQNNLNGTLSGRTGDPKIIKIKSGK